MLKRILCAAFVLVMALSARAEDITTVMSYYQPEMSRGFIYISKSDMTLTLVNSHGSVIATYPMACGRSIGPKTVKGDNKTPEGYFLLQNIHESSGWGHDFHDGKGFIKHAYGPYFLRLQTGFIGIGIHGTHAPESIGTRASEGCIRLENKHVEELRWKVSIGMPVIIGPERGVEALIASNTPRPARMVWGGDKNRPATNASAPSKTNTPLVLNTKPVVVEGLLDIDPEKDLGDAKVQVPVVEAPKVTAPVVEQTPEPVEPVVVQPEIVQPVETIAVAPVEQIIEPETVAEAVTAEPESPVEPESTADTESTGEIEYEVVVDEVTDANGEVRFEVRYVPVKK